MVIADTKKDLFYLLVLFIASGYIASWLLIKYQYIGRLVVSDAVALSMDVVGWPMLSMLVVYQYLAPRPELLVPEKFFFDPGVILAVLGGLAIHLVMVQFVRPELPASSQKRLKKTTR